MTKEHQIGVAFAAATAVFWGLYGPALQRARVPGDPNPFKAFIFIGLAYLLWGVIGGALAVKATGANLTFQSEGIRWGFIAGSLGAFGALTLTYAMFTAKRADLVMPVVFGGATAVSVITAMITLKSQNALHLNSSQLLGLPLGFILAIAGIVLIQKYAPHAPPKPAAKPDAAASAPAENPPHGAH